MIFFFVPMIEFLIVVAMNFIKFFCHTGDSVLGIRLSEFSLFRSLAGVRNLFRRKSRKNLSTHNIYKEFKY